MLPKGKVKHDGKTSVTAPGLRLHRAWDRMGKAGVELEMSDRGRERGTNLLGGCPLHLFWHVSHSRF